MDNNKELTICTLRQTYLKHIINYIDVHHEYNESVQ